MSKQFTSQSLVLMAVAIAINISVGYLVGSRATGIAIDKVRTSGIAVVGASKTWYTGMFSYYLERVVAAGFVGMVAGSGSFKVAPHGGTEGRYSTNPIAFGFPSTTTPVTERLAWA